MGVAYEKLGRFEDAVAQFERTMEVAPDYGAVRYRLGMLLWNVHGDAETAMRLYAQAIAMEGSDVAETCLTCHSPGTMLMQPATGQTSAHRLQPTHSVSSTQGTR